MIRRVVVFSAVVLLVASGAAAPAMAQSANASANTSQTETQTPAPGANVTIGGADPRTGTGGGGGGPWIDPKGWFSAIVNFTTTDFATHADNLATKFHSEMIGIPSSCGDSLGYSCVVPNPNTQPWWFVSFVLYYGSFSVLFGMQFVTLIMRYTRASYKKREEVAEEGLTQLVLLLLGFPIANLCYELMNRVNLALVPAGSEFFASPESFAKLSLGLVLGAVVISVNAVIALAGVVLGIGMAKFLIILTGMLCFAIWTNYVSFPYIKTVGAVLLAAPTLIVALRFFQAAALWFAFQLPLSLTQPESLLNAIVVVLILGVVFIYAPYRGANNILPNAVVAAGGELSSNANDAREDMQQRIAESDTANRVRERYEEIRTSDDSGSRTSEKETGGSSSPPRNDAVNEWENPSRTPGLHERGATDSPFEAGGSRSAEKDD